MEYSTRGHKGNEADGVSGVSLRGTRTDEVRQEPCDGVFLAIGHVPNTGIIRCRLDLDDQKYIRTLMPEQDFHCWSICLRRCPGSCYRQAITAAGTGCMAAMDAEKYWSPLRLSFKRRFPVHNYNMEV
ncbi:MAG: hypothetical protein Ct9H300mP29_8510 [Candidatus Neomarinimicrobiota bacterium]|nr:MAG: hypothetical protein Ct9H300mP29_8510 [Candidatus Neomarinimicrobiota bacterium]